MFSLPSRVSCYIEKLSFEFIVSVMSQKPTCSSAHTEVIRSVSVPAAFRMRQNAGQTTRTKLMYIYQS